MIPQAYITEWSHEVPWKSNEQVEQDLVICRALIHLFSDEWLASSLAFRGGTALHKLYLSPQARYSEDIDLVQIRKEPIKETIQRIQEALSFLGESSVKPKKNGNQIFYKFDSEFPPVQKLRLKIETSTREHFTVMGFHKTSFKLESSWHSGCCEINTYNLEELLGTKLRALYQRRKGRDLFDLYIALMRKPELNTNAIIESYKEYMNRSVDKPPTQKQFLLNMEEKIIDSEFLGDTKALLRHGIDYDPENAYELIKSELIEKII